MNIRKKLFGDRAFYRMVLTVTVPIMIQNGITNFVGLLDNIMVGRIGTEQMSGIAIVNQLLMVFNLAIFGAISGVGIFGAQFFGCQNYKGVQHTLRFKIYVGLGILVLGTIILMAGGDQLIQMYLHGEGNEQALQATLGYGREYLWVMLIGLPPFVLEEIYASTLREGGETKVPMIAGVVAVLVNLTLNYLLIFGKFGFPELGILGATVGTLTARTLEFLIVLAYILKVDKKLRLFSGGALLAESMGERYATKISAIGCEDVEFGFNLDYMTDALEPFKKEPSVNMKISAGSLGPIIIEAQGRGDRAMVLPVQLKKAGMAA